MLRASLNLFGSALAGGGLILISTATAVAQSDQQQPQQQQQQQAPASPAPPPAPNVLTISSSSGTPLWINGVETDRLPAEVGPGSQVCVPEHKAYKSEGDRFIFQQWSTGSTDDCISPNKPGAVYRAQYKHEVLILIKSDAPGIQRSMWVTYGEPLNLDVPDVVSVSDGDRYRFQLWSEGETPFEHSNTLAPVKPTVLEVKWAREHYINIEAPDGADIKGTGWYPDGTSLVLRAPDTLPGSSDQERWKFGSWEPDSFPAAVIQNAQMSTTALKVDGPYTVRADYDRQFLVDAQSPFGPLKHDWVKEGSDVVLEAPPTADIVADHERLVFKRWDGMDGLLSPKVTGKADKPITVTATYDRQVMLKVNAPHGAAGEGWQKAGSVATVSVPTSVAQMFLLNDSFTAFGGYPAGQASIQVLMNEPTTITALYRTEPNYLVLVLLLSLPLLSVLVYLAVTRRWIERLRLGQRLGRLRVRTRRGRGAAAAEQPLEATTTAAFPGRNGTHVTLPIGEEQR
jgi:hypothetical protein